MRFIERLRYENKRQVLETEQQKGTLSRKELLNFMNQLEIKEPTIFIGDHNHCLKE